MAKTDKPNRRPSRARTILAIVIVILILLLAVLGYYFIRVLTPLQQQTAGVTDTNGLVWVRSFYGFGPSAEEQLKSPTSVAFAPNGEIYATDPQNARIMVFSPDGTFSRLLHTGAGGLKEGQFFRPESIDVDENGDVYIADPYAGKVAVFDAAGAYLREWKIPDLEKNVTARGVHVYDGRVYVLGLGRLLVFDTEGRALGEFGSRGRRPGQIDAYQGVVSDGALIYIADSLNRRVMALDAKGTTKWIAPKTEQEAQSTSAPYQLPQDIIFDGAGRLVTIDAFKFQLVVSDPAQGDIIAAYGTDGAGEGQFLYPSGIDYDAERDWFAIADTRNNRVQLVRIPNSGGGAQSALRRALASPYRYCAIPLLLLLIVAIIAWLTSRRLRREEAEETQESAASGITDSQPQEN